jgi:hypothetical protein
MVRNAYQWGIDHGSCQGALDERRALGPDATQADWWRMCQRGDWMLWQLKRGLTGDEYAAIRPEIQSAVDRIVERAIRRVLGRSGSQVWETWAERWLSGEDRSEEAARAAAAARAEARVAWAAERAAWAARAARAARAEEEDEARLQADDIRREIAEWRWEL